MDYQSSHAGGAAPCGIGVTGGRLYVIGGYTQSAFSVWHPVATVYEYDPDADTWTQRAPMPTPRGALSVTEHEGKLYAIGGYDRTANSAAVEVYDPAGNTWASRAPLPTPRDHLATATVSGKVYAIGGRLNGDYRRNLSVTEVYDPAIDRWALAADLPTARSGITAAEVGGRVYVFGGEGGEGTFRENEAYDPARDTWQTDDADADRPPRPRVGGSAWTHSRHQWWADSRGVL